MSTARVEPVLAVGLVIAAAAAGALGCGKDSSPSPPPRSPDPVAPAPAGDVAIYVDDAIAGHVTPAQAARWPRLDSLVPVAARRIGNWDDVYLKGRGAKPAELHRISDQHPDLVPALYVADDHAVGFGLFDPVELAKRGKPQIHEDGLTEVRIKLGQGTGRGEHESGEGAAADPSTLVISIVTPKGSSKLDGSALLAIPRQPLPGETGEGRGWPLATLLEAAHVTAFTKLVLADAAGLNLTLEKTDFVKDSSVPYVKLNKQGALRFNLYKKQGTGWQRSGDLRGLVSIQVMP